MKLLILSFSILLSVTACIGSTKNGRSTNLQDTTYIDAKGNKYKMLGQIPPKLRTSEQTVYLKNLLNVVSKNLIVKDNHMFFNLTRLEFIETGLRERDYDFVQSGLVDNNAWIDKNGIKNVDKLIEKYKADLKPVLSSAHYVNLKDTAYIDTKGSEYKFLGQIPPNLRTSEQNVYLKNLLSVVSKNLIVKDNHMFFDITRQDFVKTGLLDRDYDFVQNGLIDNNEWIDSNGIKDVNKMIEKFKVDLKPVLN